jgi:hypothetical protein
MHHDSYVQETKLYGCHLISVDLNQGLGEADCTIVITNDSNLDYEKVVHLLKVILYTGDTTQEIRSAKIIRL